jgi:hypothetical protein
MQIVIQAHGTGLITPAGQPTTTSLPPKQEPWAVDLRASAAGDFAERSGRPSACQRRGEHARMRGDGFRDALAAGDLVSWVEQMGGTPFSDHPFVAAIPASRATWDAERTRVAGASDPAAWRAAAKTWEDLGWPHRAGYAWWRHAEAQLTAGQPAAAAATALRAAAAAADGHAPLLAQIRALAQRARIPLPSSPGDPAQATPAPETTAPYRLTERELAVLQLLAAGTAIPRSAPSCSSAARPPRCT